MLTVLLVDDDPEFTEIACMLLEHMGHDVRVAANLAEARSWITNASFNHVLLDFMLPDGSGMHLVDELSALSHRPKITFITGHPSIKSIIAGLCGPDIDYLVKPIDRESLEQALSGKKSNKRPSSKTKVTRHFGQLVGESDVMQSLYAQIERVAKTPANVMIFGESGVGKELVANAIHTLADCKGDFVAANCGALPTDLIGSELFGHEKGAFTGAVSRKIGVFERAANGTLFLDELTEMPIDQQPNLLRVLESKKLVRVGGTQEIGVNCRVVSATNRPVESLAKDKVLREDIYFRLAVFPITIPPLRERKHDVDLLCQAFLEDYNAETGTSYTLSNKQLNQLKDYDWPGNIRELRHLLNRAAIMSDPETNMLTLPSDIQSPFSKVATKSGTIDAGRTIDEVEKELIYATLQKVDGNKTVAADMLGISTKTLYNRLHAYGDFDEENP